MDVLKAMENPVFKENRMLRAVFLVHTIAKPSASRCAWSCEFSHKSHFGPRYDRRISYYDIQYVSGYEYKYRYLRY